MMNFKSIQKYLNYNGYYRIKNIKNNQKTNQKSAKTNAKDYDNYLDKISGFQCCCKETFPCCQTLSNGCLFLQPHPYIWRLPPALTGYQPWISS